MLIISVLINLVWSCDEWRKLKIHTDHNEIHEIELVLNNHLKSQVGACHYKVGNGKFFYYIYNNFYFLF